MVVVKCQYCFCCVRTNITSYKSSYAFRIRALRDSLNFNLHLIIHFMMSRISMPFVVTSKKSKFIHFVFEIRLYSNLIRSYILTRLCLSHNATICCLFSFVARIWVRPMRIRAQFSERPYRAFILAMKCHFTVLNSADTK